MKLDFRETTNRALLTQQVNFILETGKGKLTSTNCEYKAKRVTPEIFNRANYT